jgi:D-alanyl-D-alanine carboxypeptidase/D-alanyl-D-alanine-endopeptidase (penicillin-binding protein 4)
MTRPWTRRSFLAAGLAGLAGAGLADAPKVSLRPQARPAGLAVRAAPPATALIDAARLGGDVSYAVVDAASGQLLEAHAPAAGQPPASVTKALTALYALETLGGGYRFTTRLIATGPVEKGVLKGDLVLAGGGDPTLDTDALAQMAADLKQAGVHAVQGRFRVWDGAMPFERMIDPEQPAHVGYNPAVSGLNLNFNRVHFQWKRESDGYAVSMDARTRKYRPDVQVARMAVAKRKTPVYTYKDAGDHDRWTVARWALGQGGARWLPVRKPGAYAAEVFAIFARSHGIPLRVAPPLDGPPQGRTLVPHRSETLREILRGMLKYSTNLTAELVGMTATAARRDRAAPSLRASAQEMTDWAQHRLDIPDARLLDHSGLDEDSRLTAAGMAHALADRRGTALPALLKTIKMRDPHGRPDPDHPVQVRAKTGTLYFVSSLAGYATLPGGRELAFAIFSADTGRRADIDTTRDERPAGARAWNRRAKGLQQALIERWSAVHGT